MNNYITKNGKLLKLGVKERKERTEVKVEVGKEGGHREGPMENGSGKISLVGEKGVHRTPSPFPSLEEGVRHKTTRIGRPAQPGLEMTNQNRIKSFDKTEDPCKLSVSVKGVEIVDMKAFLARKKQERDQRKKIVRRPDKNQTSEPEYHEEHSKPSKSTEKGEVQKVQKAWGPKLGMGSKPSYAGKLEMIKKV